MTETMAIWDAVSKTNPANTKKVNQRGGFTAINAHSQVMEATRQFGPIGIGWGYEAATPIRMDELLIVPVTLWHGDRANTFGPLFGAAELHDSKGRLDNDAPKKATTDGLTKGLSLLGFNADVFLGLFDDNKYVERVAKEFEAEKEPKAREKLDGEHTSKTALRTAVHAIIAKVRTLKTVEDIDKLKAEHKRTINQALRDWPALITGNPEIEEDAGLKGAFELRRMEVDEESSINRALQDMRETVTGLGGLATWADTNSAFINELNEAERAYFDREYNAFGEGLELVERVAAG